MGKFNGEYGAFRAVNKMKFGTVISEIGKRSFQEYSCVAPVPRRKKQERSKRESGANGGFFFGESKLN